MNKWRVRALGVVTLIALSGALTFSCSSGEETGQAAMPICYETQDPAGNCSGANAKAGAPCTCDCQVACGYQKIGLKHCTCASGAYTQCPCPRPETFLAAEFAPFCDTLLGGDGFVATYKDKACDVEWQNCINRDAHTGTPRGCVCMKDPSHGLLVWECGSTNRWFALEPGAM
jgi:hypothetical protein